MPTSLDALIESITQNAALPLEVARSLPPAAYTSQDYYELEQRDVFGRSWVCVGRASALDDNTTWLRADVAGEPIVITKDRTGVLRVMSRICRHRSMDILSYDPGQLGSSERFTCPYHAWSYRLDGSLIGAPEMGGSQEFDTTKCALPQYRVEVWHGFLFVCLDRHADDLRAHTAPIDDLLGDLDMSDYIVAFEFGVDDLEGNWKSAYENSIEAYHLLSVHKQTLLPTYPLAKSVVYGTRTCGWGWSGKADEAPTDTRGRLEEGPSVDLLPGLPERARTEQFVFALFPSFFAIVYPTYVVYLRFVPDGPGRHHQVVGLLYPPGTVERNPEAVAAMADTTTNPVVEEDFAVIAAVSRGLHAPSAVSGPLSHHEALLWHFQQFLADRFANR